MATGGESHPQAPHPEVLVIGYGSELRRDDAVGPRVARQVDTLRLPGVQVLACTQLTPELAEPISRVSAVVFVDASVRVPPATLEWEQLDSQARRVHPGHTWEPATLLALAETLFGRTAPGRLLRIGVRNLAVGDRLSPEAEAALPAAVQAVTAEIRRCRQGM